MFGYEAIKIILNGYKEIAKNGEDARIPLLKDFLIASNYAGIAFGNAGCAAVHAMSYRGEAPTTFLMAKQTIAC